MMMHFDGIFSELGYAMPQVALQALLTNTRGRSIVNTSAVHN